MELVQQPLHNISAAQMAKVPTCICLPSPSPTNLLVEPVVCQKVDELLPVIASHTDVLASRLQLHYLAVGEDRMAYNTAREDQCCHGEGAKETYGTAITGIYVYACDCGWSHLCFTKVVVNHSEVESQFLYFVILLQEQKVPAEKGEEAGGVQRGRRLHYACATVHYIHITRASHVHQWVPHAHHMGVTGHHMGVTCPAHGCHMPSTWVSHAHHMGVTCPSHGCHRPSHGCHMPITWVSHAYHMGFTCPSHGCHMPITWESHAHHMGVTCPSHGCHLPITWVSHAHHMGVVPITQVSSPSHGCYMVYPLVQLWIQ